MKEYNISIVGAGYVGLSLAVLISQRHKVSLIDINKDKVNKINKKISPIKDKEIQKFLKTKELRLTAISDNNTLYKNSKFIIVATPTDFNIKKGNFNTSSVEGVIKQIVAVNKSATIVIKSTVPLGFTEKMRKLHGIQSIFFSPEFLREGNALYDNLFPSRIVIGDKTRRGKSFANILIECSKIKKTNHKIYFMSSHEAEAVKLFSNTYLAMRVAFFNELDTFAEVHNLSAEKIILGVSSDQRIGNFYNNPSFGYGGYCLPKDTRQLLNNFKKVPNSIIKSVIQANKIRKEYVAGKVIKKFPKSVGVYKLTMKKNSDNFRESAVHEIINKLLKKNIIINLYEPLIKYSPSKKIILIKDLNEFIKKSEVIIANRLTQKLKKVRNKVYSRDIFGKN